MAALTALHSTRPDAHDTCDAQHRHRYCNQPIRGWTRLRAQLAQHLARHLGGMPHTVLKQSLLGSLVLAVGLGACSSDSTGPAPTSDANRVWAVTFPWHAVNLALVAPYDTATLAAIPRTVTGAVVTDSAVVQYSTPDSSVTVSQTGLVTARFPTSGARVVARVTIHGTSYTDTTLVQVVPTPPDSLATLSIQPKPDDSDNGGLLSADFYLTLHGETYWIPFYATTTAGDTVCNAYYAGCVDYPLLVHYETLDPTIAVFDDQYGDFDPIHTGRVTVIVSTLAYGVPKADTLRASIGTPNRWSIADTLDASLHFYLRGGVSATAKPWTVGFGIIIQNFSGSLVELSVPGPAHGVYFQGAKSMQLLDTLSGDPKDYSHNFVKIQFDSTGKYTIRHRLLSTGDVIDQTYTIVPFP